MAFNEKIYNECEDNTNFSGNFQTEFYFEQIAADIRHDFTFKKEYLEPCQEFIDSNGDKITIYSYMFVEVIQTSQVEEERSGLIKWCKSIIPYVRKNIILKH